VGVCVCLCMTLSSTINTMIHSSPACSRKKTTAITSLGEKPPLLHVSFLSCILLFSLVKF